MCVCVCVCVCVERGATQEALESAADRPWLSMRQLFTHTYSPYVLERWYEFQQNMDSHGFI